MPAFNESEYRNTLAYFTGSESFTRFGLWRTLATEGAIYTAEALGAFWLLDEIAANNLAQPRVRLAEFQVWKLKVDVAKSTARLSVEDGNDRELWAKVIPFTDCPVEDVTLWHIGGVILLPTEY